MPDEPSPFAFPPWMPRDEAHRLLAQAYASLDAGKMLRRALKRQRDDGWDPPEDVQYVVEPQLVDFDDGVGIGVTSDILLHEEFPGVDECVRIFEDVVADALVARTQRLVDKWVKRNPPP